MDITETLAAKSDQLDAVDLLAGPRVFTVESVSKGNAEQPINVHLREFPRVWRPGKSMRRVLAGCWGAESSVWTGRRVRLFCDPDVRFGGDRVGGTRISHLSHIDGPQEILLLEKRGKSGFYTVEPLPDDAPTSEAVSPDTLTELGALFSQKGIPGEARLSGVARIIGAEVADLEALTEAQAQQVMATLRQRPDKGADQ